VALASLNQTYHFSLNEHFSTLHKFLWGSSLYICLTFGQNKIPLIINSPTNLLCILLQMTFSFKQFSAAQDITFTFIIVYIKLHILHNEPDEVFTNNNIVK
jgi:hypothetical protein